MAVDPSSDVRVGTKSLRLAPHGWRRRQAPLRGARIATGDYSWSDLSVWQHWHQFCWNGGLGADKWVDDAMFDEGVGLDTTVADQVSLSRDISHSAGLDAQSLGRPRKFITWTSPNGTKRLYCVTMPATADAWGSKVWQYENGTDTWTLVKTFGSGWKARSLVRWSGEFCIGFGNGKIRRTETPNTVDSWKTTHQPKKARGRGVAYMMPYQARLYVAYGDLVYRRKGNWKIDGKTEFYDPAGHNSKHAIIAMDHHLGSLYMASKHGHLHQSDGNKTHDIWQWSGGTQIMAIRSFDGRLFVATYEFEDDDEVGVQGIYQFTGGAVTQLKSWGTRTKASMMGDFTVHDRKLFYGAPNLWGMNEDIGGTDHGGFGVAVFDPIEDAHSIWASNKDAITYPDPLGDGRSWIVDDVIFWRGQLHAAVRQHGNFRVRTTYRDYVDGTVDYDTSKQSATGQANAGFLTSSNYDGGTPGLDKLWQYCKVTGYVPLNTSVSVYYSVDEGDTWVLVGTLAGVAGAEEVEHRWSIPELRSNQIKYRLELDSTDSSVSPVMKGVTWSYLPMPEPNWMWDLTITVGESVEGLDYSLIREDTDALIAQLATWYRDQKVLEFEDIDGVEWAPGVIIWDFVDNYHVPGFEDDPREGTLRLSLLEVQPGA